MIIPIIWDFTKNVRKYSLYLTAIIVYNIILYHNCLQNASSFLKKRGNKYEQ